MVKWVKFQEEVLAYKVPHPCGHTFPLVTQRNISLLGLLETVGRASSDYMATGLYGRAVSKTERETIIGRMYWYLFQYYETIQEYGTIQRVPIAEEDIPLINLVWRITSLTLQLQKLTTPQISVEAMFDIVIFLKQLEAAIHQLAAAYCLSINSIRISLLATLRMTDKRTIPDILVDHSMLLEDGWVLRALQNYAIAGNYETFLVSKNDVLAFLPQFRITHRRFKEILNKLERLKLLGRKRRQLYITRKAEKILLELAQTDGF